MKYLDIPLQHCDGNVLKKMNRHGDRATLTALIDKIRREIPGIIIRTTLIAGFPGETEEQFSELVEFVKTMRFERLGCFAYSQEEGTAAAKMDGQLDEDIKQHRADIIMQEQMFISDRFNQKLLGSDIEIVVEGFDRYAECWFGRSAMDAPEIDGKIFFTCENKPAVGEYIKVHIDDTLDYDLIGTWIE